MNKKYELILIVLLYAVCLYIWTLPINELPFGDVDSSTHFGLGDYMYQTDNVIWNLPLHLNQPYGVENHGRLWYPPQYHLDEAIVQTSTNSRVISAYLFNALACSIIVLTSFLLIRKLYGFWPAFLSSFLIIFSTRDYLYYILGLWPQTASFAIIPAVIYCYYMYTDSYINSDTKPIYLYIMMILLALQYFFHAHPMLHSIAFIMVYSLLLIIKHKEIIWNKKHILIKHILIAIVLLLVLSLPFLQFIFGKVQKETSEGIKLGEFSSLSSWYPSEDRYRGGYPSSFFSFKGSHGGYWLLPLLLIGIALLFLRRKENDIVMISWLVSYYLMIHLNIIGMGGRIPRSFGGEAQIFYPLAAIGLIGIATFIKLKQVKYVLIAVFVVLGLVFNAVPAYEQFKNTYTGISRVSQDQIEISEWIKDNTDNKDFVYVLGPLGHSKKKWFRIYSERRMLWTKTMVPQFNPEFLEKSDYLLVDYSDSIAIGNRELIFTIQDIEKKMVANKTPIYQTTNMRVYNLEAR